MEKPCAFVTGISEGVGKCVAMKLSKMGYSVIGLSRSRPKYISEYPDIHWFFFDLSKDFDHDVFVSSIHKHTHTINLIIFNAAYAYYGKVFDLPETHLKQMVNTNLISSIYILKHLLPMMGKSSQVVFVGSSAEYLPAPNMGIYAALKVAQSHLSMTLNIECIHKNIKFKVIKPGFINTSFAQKSSVPFSAFNEKLAMHPDKVAFDIIRLMKKNTLSLHSGWVSKLLYVLNRISIKSCFMFSKKRHGDI
jgi:short-subunit dehydrogenase